MGEKQGDINMAKGKTLDEIIKIVTGIRKWSKTTSRRRHCTKTLRQVLRRRGSSWSRSALRSRRIAEAHHDRVAQEVEYERGNGRLLRDFRTYKELYTHKISQQEGLAKELRKRQKHLKESEGDNLGQRQMFADMRKLLAAKLSAKDAEMKQNNQIQNAGSAETDSLMMDINGANVMTIS